MFRTILFDIDGVMLSEERYFDASALTIYELLFSPQYFHLAPGSLPGFRSQFTDDEIVLIRKTIFAEDQVLKAMKKLGINANWDMVYLQTTFQLTQILKVWRERVGSQNMHEVLAAAPDHSWTRDTVAYLGQRWSEQNLQPGLNFAQFQEFAADCQSKADLFRKLDDSMRGFLGHAQEGYFDLGMLWDLGQETFQEWYLGDDYVPSTYQHGKPGFLMNEVPLVEPEKFSALLAVIQRQGIELGIATGRPRTETYVPLSHFGWLSYFPEAKVSTASDVLAAELEFPEYRPLAKPNPFSYLRSFLGITNAATVIEYPLPIPTESGRSTLVVGDSVADLLAARSMGCQFAAVLTGLEGEKARKQFEELGSDYIWNDALGVFEVIT